MRKASLVLTLLIALACVAVAWGDPGTRVLAKKTVSGRKASALVVAKVSPRTSKDVRVQVESTPEQRATAGWVMVCTVGGRASGRNSRGGTFTTPFSIRVDLQPADTCTLTADARLSGRRRLTLSVLAR